jgi:hypothetical protein
MAKPSKQPRIKGRFAAKPKDQPDRNEEILQGILDRLHGLEATLSKVDSSVAVIRSGATFMQQLERDAPSMRELIQAELRSISNRIDALRMEQYALAQDTPINPLMNNGIVEPQPSSLQPGDYCDASKEVADELTAMGFKWADGDRWSRPFIRITPDGAALNFDVWKSELSYTHLDAPTFLSRARVTAKELGLTPVDLAAEEAKRKEAERAEKVKALNFGRLVHAKENDGDIEREYRILGPTGPLNSQLYHLWHEGMEEVRTIYIDQITIL